MGGEGREGRWLVVTRKRERKREGKRGRITALTHFPFRNLKLTSCDSIEVGVDFVELFEPKSKEEERTVQFDASRILIRNESSKGEKEEMNE